MNGTIYMPVGEACSSISDTYREKKNMVTLINTSDVLEGRVLNHERVPNSNLKGQFKKTFQRDDILYSEIRPQNRRFAYVDFSPIDYIASTKLMVIRAKKDVVSPKYLYYFLKNTSTVAELQLLAETRSGTFPQITFSEVANLTIPVPSLAVQEVIVQTMQCLEDKITCNEQINDNLEQQAMALYRQMFVENNNDARRECRADEYFDISIGKTPPRKEAQWFSMNPTDCIWVSISDMGRCGMYIADSSEYLTHESVDKFNIKVVPDNTVLLSFKLTVGRVAITDGAMVTNEAIAHFKTDKPEINEYLYCYLKDFNYQTMGSTSSIATAVNSKIIKAMPFVIPTDAELVSFHSVTAPMFEMIKTRQRENTRLAELRDSLLPKLMSGEIDVSDIQL